MERIFDKFYRGQAHNGHPGGRRIGSGLGLAICRGFIEAMGGRIVAGNREDRSGAVFAITLPVPEQALLEKMAQQEITAQQEIKE